MKLINEYILSVYFQNFSTKMSECKSIYVIIPLTNSSSLGKQPNLSTMVKFELDSNPECLERYMYGRIPPKVLLHDLDKHPDHSQNIANRCVDPEF